MNVNLISSHSLCQQCANDFLRSGCLKTRFQVISLRPVVQNGVLNRTDRYRSFDRLNLENDGIKDHINPAVHLHT